MDLYQKISVLGPSAQYDTCGPRDFGKTTDIPGVYHAKIDGSRICRLFKVLQTNTCCNNCRYCAFRRDRSCQRTVCAPDEMAKAFDSAYCRRLVDGFFLSSGVSGTPGKTMSLMLDTISILRKKYQYRGYIHLKIMPGSPDDCIRQSLLLANRVSLNIESPTENDLAFLSPEKSLKDGFFKTLFSIKRESYKLQYAGKKIPSLTTQFVVGAGNEKDLDIVKTTYLLYQNFKFKRIFYSAFRPISETPLAEKPATPLVRQNRLYQADFLMRFYRFFPEDIYFDQDGFLPQTTDPKMLWAQHHPEFFPVDLNKAGFWDLIKIPGIGPTSARKIIKMRRQAKIRSLEQFSKMRIQIKKIFSFICW